MIHSERLDTNRLLPKGTSKIWLHPDREKLSLKGNKEFSRSIVAAANSNGKHLAREFLATKNRPETTTLLLEPISLPDGGVISAVGQAAPYCELSGLGLASRDNQTDLEKIDKLPAYYPADLPQETKEAYIAMKLAGLQTAWNHAKGTGIGVPVVMEHPTPSVSTDEHPYPRTVPLPHATFGIIDTKQIEPGEIDDVHLRAEQKVVKAISPLLALVMQMYIKHVLEAKGFDSDGIEVRARDEEPYGYGIHFTQITPQTLTDPENIRFVTAVLDAEHNGNDIFGSGIIKKLPEEIEGSHRRPQPASRQILYIHTDDDDKGDHLTAITSPVVYYEKGGMEASGCELDRSPKHPRIHTTEEVEIFRAKAGKNIQTTVSSLHQHKQ